LVRLPTLTGGDILTVLRLALPACIRTAPEAPALSRLHLEEAVGRVQQAKRDIGRDRTTGRDLTQLPWRRPLDVAPTTSGEQLASQGNQTPDDIASVGAEPEKG